MQNPLNTISELLYELKQQENLLLQIKERPGFTTILTPGEQGSIDAMIKSVRGRIHFANALQEQFV